MTSTTSTKSPSVSSQQAWKHVGLCQEGFPLSVDGLQREPTYKDDWQNKNSALVARTPARFEAGNTLAKEHPAVRKSKM